MPVQKSLETYWMHHTHTCIYCEPGCNGDEWVLHTPQISGTGASPSDAI